MVAWLHFYVRFVLSNVACPLSLCEFTFCGFVFFYSSSCYQKRAPIFDESFGFLDNAISMKTLRSDL